MDDGILTDSQGRKVSFRHTVLIMTSNIGGKLITDQTSLGFGSQDVEQTYQDIKSRVLSEVKKYFSPEFLNRLDDIIVFRPLTRDQVGDIAKLLIGRLQQRLREEHGIELELADSALDLLIERGFDPKYGARPMRRTIERLVEDPIAERILTKEFPEGSTIVVEAVGERMAFRRK
jgi:ATP-dependent Clp protease ATP-binding subunit ClpC